MSTMRAQRAGEVLGSGLRAGTSGMVAIAPCPAVSGAADPIGAIASRLEAAGSCLLALPERGYSPHLRITRYDVVRSALDAYGWEASRIRPPHPSGAEIDRMDEALEGLGIIRAALAAAERKLAQSGAAG
ncbi:MAG: hypothetical protein B7Z64_06865 [Acidiphilium sp. 21-68-69]|nr:MAG: hypothetical protein B7Z64_06865 [Acidiphilium sp. 21-68-69]